MVTGSAGDRWLITEIRVGHSSAGDDDGPTERVDNVPSPPASTPATNLSAPAMIAPAQDDPTAVQTKDPGSESSQGRGAGVLTPDLKLVPLMVCHPLPTPAPHRDRRRQNTLKSATL